MQDKLKEATSKLGSTEKEFVNGQYAAKLQLWAKLIDGVELGLHHIADIPNIKVGFNNVKDAYESILTIVSSLDIANNESDLTDLRNQTQYFSEQYFRELLDYKQKIQAVIGVTPSAIDGLQDAVLEAQETAEAIKKQTLDFAKSFQANLKKQAGRSQKVLATHFKKRLQDLKSNEVTSPEKWLEKRNWWFVKLLTVIASFACVSMLIFVNKWLKGYELQLATLKLAVVAAVYLQYHFAAKNYHIYADLVAKYEHLAVVSETITDFTAAAFENEELNGVVYANAAKTLFSEVSTGHLKQAAQEASVIENFINQIPKGGQ